MSKTLTEIAQQLKDTDKKVQLIYGFNGMGKTRLSRALKNLIETDDNPTEFTQKKFLYYNSFTEDLFYWPYESGVDLSPILQAHQNGFTNWIFNKQDLEVRIDGIFKRVTGTRVDFYLDKKNNSIAFKMPEKSQLLDSSGEPVLDEDGKPMAEDIFSNIKISKGEESNFKWSIFYVLLEQIIATVNDPENEDPEFLFDKLEYVFIDDPVSSLDENHLIELAVSLAMLLKTSPFSGGQGIKFVITTHNPLFYNVLWNEFNNDLYKNRTNGKYRGNNADDNEEYDHIYKRGQCDKYRLSKNADGTFELKNSNDHPFSYHLFLLSELRKAIVSQNIEKYHFSFLRNLLEKTATFLGYKKWENLLDKLSDSHQNFVENRILNLSSHSAHGGEEMAEVTPADLEKLAKLVEFLTDTYGFCKAEENL